MPIKPGTQPGHGLHHGQGRGFAAVEHGFAHTDRLQGKEIRQAGVNALIAAADQGQVFFRSQGAGLCLGEGASAGGQEQHPARPGNGAQGAGQGVGLHDHAGAAAVGAVVHMAVFVHTVLARVVKGKTHHAAARARPSSPADQGGSKKFRKKRNQVEARHGRRVPQKGSACKPMRNQSIDTIYRNVLLYLDKKLL